MHPTPVPCRPLSAKSAAGPGFRISSRTCFLPAAFPRSAGVGIIALAGVLAGCMPDSGNGPDGGSRLRKAVTRMQSSVLPAQPAGPDPVPSQYPVSSHDPVPAFKPGGPSLPASAHPALPEEERCDSGKPCLTPLNLEGRIYSGHFMVGGNGGPPGFPVRVVEGYDTTHHGPETGRGGMLKFDLGAVTDLSGNYACCEGGSYPPDDLAVVKRLEFLFDYLDATFTVPLGAGPGVAGRTYTVRTVYVDSGSADDLPQEKSAFRKGDKLLRRAGEERFHWCTESGCIAAARPESPLRAAWHDEEGLTAYPHYVTVGINLKTPMTFTRGEAERGNWKFTVDFDLARAAVFNTTAWSMIRSEAELVQAFDLLSRHGGPGGIGVDVELTKTALDTAAARVP